MSSRRALSKTLQHIGPSTSSNYTSFLSSSSAQASSNDADASNIHRESKRSRKAKKRLAHSETQASTEQQNRSGIRLFRSLSFRGKKGLSKRFKDSKQSSDFDLESDQNLADSQISYSKQLRDWRMNNSGVYLSRHHVRFNKQFSVPLTELPPCAAALLERSIFPHSNYPVIDSLPVHALPPAGIDEKCHPYALKRYSYVSQSRYHPCLPTDSRYSLQHTAVHDHLLSSSNQQKFSHNSEPSSRLTSSSEKKDHREALIPADNSSLNVQNKRNSIPDNHISNEEFSQRIGSDSEDMLRNASAVQPGERNVIKPRPAWIQSKEKRTAQAAFADIETQQGHNRDADTSTFVIDVPLPIFDQLLLLPSQLPQEV